MTKFVDFPSQLYIEISADVCAKVSTLTIHIFSRQRRTPTVNAVPR